MYFTILYAVLHCYLAPYNWELNNKSTTMEVIQKGKKPKNKILICCTSICEAFFVLCKLIL